jgi:hypothetical protein
MEGLKNLNINWPKFLKITAIIMGAVVLLIVFINLVIGPVFSQFNRSSTTMMGVNPQSASFDSYSNVNGYKSDAGLTLSARNAEGLAMSAQPGNISSQGSFEVTQYNATIETGKLDKDCAEISALKAKDFVIFENSNTSKHNCIFSFKVDRDKVDEVLPLIKNLKPRDLSQNIESIKKQVEDFTSREEILKNKQASIEETLKSALAAYSEITNLATKTNDAESLAKVIDSKIGIVERLTNERLQVSAELENLSRSKAEQLDRLKYINFYVYIYENKIFDGQALKDSWINSFKQFVFNINQILDDLSLGLVVIFFQILKFLLYIFIILIVAKYSWGLVKKIWKK